MKYLIIGLGNPGSKYQYTRHNIGFMILDALASQNNIFYEENRYAAISYLRFRGRKLILVKPNTYMNLSGHAVRYWMQKLKIQTTNLLVLTDDISLPFGKLRMRKKGSDGGHNGLKSINNLLGQDYSRLRFGIGNDFVRGKQSDYVLSDFAEEEAIVINEKINLAIEMIKSYTTIGIDLTMSNFNQK
tara:strand:+ start:271 stop:831 length:561 start_codon:yes stop_codon:yes gene_type:complete